MAALQFRQGEREENWRPMEIAQEMSEPDGADQRPRVMRRTKSGLRTVASRTTGGRPGSVSL